MNSAVKMYKKLFIKRYDRESHIKYFTHEDFPGLKRTDFRFRSERGDILSGGIYSYENADRDPLVIFCHGIGCGHLNYMHEIEYLCRSGYTVLAYDNTGCDSSEGENICAFSQSLSDLNACLNAVRADELFADRRIFVIGHSWGGYAAGNILNFREDIDKVVVLSGFVCVERLIRQYMKGILGVFVAPIMRYERLQNPLYADSASDSGYLKTTARVLLIQSEDDPIVPMSVGIGYLQKAVLTDNIRFLVTDGKKHNPNYTVDAVQYLNERFSALNKAVKTKKIKNAEEKQEFMKDVDWLRMTAQDPEVWTQILDFLRA